MPDEFLTVSEIAERLKVNQQTVRNWIDRGELGAVRLGARRVRVLPSELERFITESTAARKPSEQEARAALMKAQDALHLAADDRDQLVPALRQLSTAALALARALSSQR